MASPNPVTRRRARETSVDHQINPFRSFGTLGAIEFILTLICLVVALALFQWFLKPHLQSARLQLHIRDVLLFYGVWFVGVSLGFFLITNAFIKRWAAILGTSSPSRFFRLFTRVSLLSPLLAIWLTLFTLLFVGERESGGAWPLRAGVSRIRILLAGIVVLILFHLGYLGQQWRAGKLKWEGGVRLASTQVFARESIVSLMGDKAQTRRLLSSGFWIHVFPYLDPGGKYMASILSDFQRVQLIRDQIAQAPASLCEKKAIYLGDSVDDCFMQSYQKVSGLSPFATPVFGFMNEVLYQQKNLNLLDEMLKRPGTSPWLGAKYILMMSRNMVSLLEPHAGVRGRGAFFEPRGLLEIYGSPEIPMLAFGQDLQSYLLVTKLLPTLEPALESLEENLGKASGAETSREYQDIRGDLEDLKQRISRLRDDPLRIGVYH